MSFNIILQTNSSEMNRLDKTLTDIITIPGALKADTSIIDPVIVVNADLSNYLQANYMTIDAFSRKYFITNIKSINAALFEISAHVDVLSSYAAHIRTNKGIVYRQQNRWNLYLNDGSFKLYQNPIVLTKAFPSGFSSMELVMAVAGS